MFSSDDSNMARGFSIIGLSVGIGRLVAPVTGAFLARPALEVRQNQNLQRAFCHIVLSTLVSSPVRCLSSFRIYFRACLAPSCRSRALPSASSTLKRRSRFESAIHSFFRPQQYTSSRSPLCSPMIPAKSMVSAIRPQAQFRGSHRCAR